LFYPAPFEGEELSKNVFYTGAAPNQLALPSVEFLLSKDGGSAQRFVLIGTDYVYPRTINKIIRSFLKTKGISDSDVTEEYIRFGESDFGQIIANAKRFSLQGRKTAIISTINGDSNVPFYRELNRQGIRSNDLPVLSLTLDEEELRGVDAKPLQGYLSASNYFMSLKNPVNDEFLRKWTAYARSKGIVAQRDKPLVTYAMEATYIGVQMWAEAVRNAKSTATDKVISAMAGQIFNAPSGTTVMMDSRNHYLHKSLFVGEVKADGQFNVVWRTRGPIRAQPWSPYIPENKGKKDEPDRR
jgi:urea transport system substrate-binding protein